MADIVHVAWIFDEAVSLEASVAITSVVLHADPEREYVFHLLVDQVGPGRLEAIGDLACRNVSIQVHQLNLVPYRREAISHAMQMRLERTALGRHLPELDRVLYLDTDLVALSDIARLYDTALCGRSLAAVVDLHIQRQCTLGRGVAGQADIHRYFQDTLLIEEDLKSSYFNTGVLLLNLNYMRTHDIENAVREIMERGDRLLIPDQCAINKLMIREATLVDSRWNVLVPSSRFSLWLKQSLPDRQRRKDFADPFILHFAGGKPWRHRVRPKTSYWWACAMASPLRREITSNFLHTRGRDIFSTLRSKVVGWMQMLVGHFRLRAHRAGRVARQVKPG